MMTRGINKITIFIFRFVIVNTNRLEALKESVKYQIFFIDYTVKIADCYKDI